MKSILGHDIDGREIQAGSVCVIAQRPALIEGSVGTEVTVKGSSKGPFSGTRYLAVEIPGGEVKNCLARHLRVIGRVTA